MRITVHAKPKSAEEYIEQTGDNEYTVAVKEPPIAGKANDAIIKALADHFGVLRVQVKIVSGYTSRNKIIEVVEMQRPHHE